VQKAHKVRGVPGKKVVKKAAKKAPAKKAAVKKVAKKAPAKKTPAKKVAKKAPAKKVAAKKAPVKKAPVKKSIPVKKAPGRPFPSKVGKTTLTVDEKSQTVSVATVVAPTAAPVVEERLKPIKSAPTPVTASSDEGPWTAAELKAIRAEIAADLERLRAELASVEAEMDELIADSGEGAGDDQADSGTKTFEREHEMSLVINARDMVLQTERALERIDAKTYGMCEECGSPIGKARLQVFPRATLCMICKQKEERR
jgi:RNA polymerase-binding transcription factor DksA